MRLNPVLGNDVAEGGDGGLGEGALAHLQTEIVGSEGGQGSPQIPIMGLLVAAVDDDIVDVVDDSCSPRQGLLNEPLEDGGGVLESHGQAAVSPHPEWSESCGEVPGLGVEKDMEIALPQVQFGEDPGPTQLEEEVLDVREGMALRNDKGVKRCQIGCDPYTPSALRDRDEGVGPLRCLDRLPDARLIHCLNFLPHGFSSCEGDGTEAGYLRGCIRAHLDTVLVSGEGTQIGGEELGEILEVGGGSLLLDGPHCPLLAIDEHSQGSQEVGAQDCRRGIPDNVDLVLVGPGPEDHLGLEPPPHSFRLCPIIVPELKSGLVESLSPEMLVEEGLGKNGGCSASVHFERQSAETLPRRDVNVDGN